MNTSTPTSRNVSFANGVTLHLDERGTGRPVLVLHGGGGPQTMAGLVATLAIRKHVLLPTHPGFAGEPRPEWFNSVADLAIAYLDLLEQLNLRDVMVVGSSMGGWIAAEMAVRDTSRLNSLVLINATGIEVEDHPIADIFPLTPAELSALSFHNPAAFRIDPSTLSPTQIATAVANKQTLAVYAQEVGSLDPKLRRRLGRVQIPVLVIWGESDRVVDVEYGRAYAQAFPHARFEPIAEAGHLTWLEQPERTFNALGKFAISVATPL